MNRANSVKVRSADEDQLRELLVAAQSGDPDAKEQILQANLGLVYSVVKRYLYSGKEYEDLFQLGCIGLVKAIERFDLRFDVCFSTYAVPLIMGEIRRYLRDDSPISVSRSLKERAAKIEKARWQWQMEKGCDPSVQELAEGLCLRNEDVVTAVLANRQVLSLQEEQSFTDGDTSTLEQHLADVAQNDDEILERIDLQMLIRELPPRLAHIISQRYFYDRTQMEIAAELGVSQVQISRLEKRALQLLREQLQSKP